MGTARQRSKQVAGTSHWAQYVHAAQSAQSDTCVHGNLLTISVIKGRVGPASSDTVQRLSEHLASPLLDKGFWPSPGKEFIWVGFYICRTNHSQGPFLLKADDSTANTVFDQKNFNYVQMH